MLEKSIVDQASCPDAVTRGFKIASSGGIRDIQLDSHIGTEVMVSADVRGSGSRMYRTRVTIDTAAQEVTGFGCTCPAAQSMPGMCKHAIALAFRAAAMLPGEEKPKPQKTPGAPAGKQPKPRPVPKARTSFRVERMLDLYAERSRTAASVTSGHATSETAADETPVDLTVIIGRGVNAQYSSSYCESDSMWHIGLKVSRGKTSYLVKHIDELVGAWREGALYTYGKKLSFVHAKSAFTPRANQLIETLQDIVDAQSSAFELYERRSYEYPSSKPSTRTLPLSSEQLVKLLSMLVGTDVDYEYEEADTPGGRSKATIPVRDGDPALDVEIRHDDARECYLLSIEPSDATFVPGHDDTGFLIAPNGAWQLSGEFVCDLGLFCASILPQDQELVIADADMPAFCATVLHPLREHTRLTAPGQLDALLPPEPEFEFRIGLEDGAISCHAEVSYGGRIVGLFDDVQKGQPVRAVEQEVSAQEVVRSYFPFGDNGTPSYTGPRLGHAPVFGGTTGDEPLDPWMSVDDDEAYYLLFSRGLAELEQVGEVLLSERLARVRVRTSPGVEVDASVAAGSLHLNVDSSELSNEELLAYLAAYRRKQRYLRLSDGDVMRIGTSIARVAELAEGLGIDAARLVESDVELPANRTLFVDALLKRADGVRFSRDEGFRRIVREFETIADADIPLPDGLDATLRPYQEEGYRWLCMLGQLGFGGILADDMGLGKTLQTIAYLLHEANKRAQGASGTSLVVCPASLVYNWMAELARFAPGLKTYAVVGTKAERGDAIAAASGFDVLVTSYDYVRRDIELLACLSFGTVVLDEAHYIKNAKTQAARSVKRLSAKRRFALTGTPVENRLSDLWSIFDFLMPGVLGTQKEFARRFSAPIDGGDDAAAKRLQSLVGPFILRRLKSDVLGDLPEKDESIVYAEMADEQDKLYRASASKLARSIAKQLPEDFAGSKLQILAELSKLRELCCDPSLLYDNYTGGSAKLDTCMELVSTALEADHSVLLFSQFTSMLDLIAARLDKEGADYQMLTGSTSKEERMRLVRRFQEGDVPVFLISLKAGGVGLNLTAADIVIHYDPWWNVAAENQATDRAHRIGQTRTVTVFKLIVKDTIEEGILALQQRKRELADSIVGGEALGSTTITRDDVLALLDAGR